MENMFNPFDANKERKVLWFEHILKKSRSYKALFKHNNTFKREAEIVLSDLRKFCNFNTTTAQSRGPAIDPLQMARMEGRREVYLRILVNLNTDENEIIKLKEGE